MGWLFYSKSKQELIQKLTSTDKRDRYSLVTIDHELNDEGNVLWALSEWAYTKDCGAVEKATFITCYLLDFHGGQWGYKDIDEQAHPFYCDCPLRFLDKADYRPCEEWRAKVRKWHEKYGANSIPRTMPVTA
jgi:hypothetical protein